MDLPIANIESRPAAAQKCAHFFSPSLKASLTKRLEALLAKSETLQRISEADPIAMIEGLSQAEILVVAVLAGTSFNDDNAVSAFSARRDAQRAGMTNLGFNLGVRRLVAKGFVKVEQLWDENSDESYDGLRLTPIGWAWVEANESQFVLHRPKEDDKLPF